MVMQAYMHLPTKNTRTSMETNIGIHLSTEKCSDINKLI